MTLKSDSDQSIHSDALAKKHNKFAVFMCYVTWLFLRFSVKVGGKKSGDAYKEGMAGASMSATHVLYMLCLIIIVHKYVIILNKVFVTCYFIIVAIMILGLSFWIGSYEDKYYPIFKKMSRKERKKWDRCGMLYVFGTYILFFGIMLTIHFTAKLSY